MITIKKYLTSSEILGRILLDKSKGAFIYIGVLLLFLFIFSDI